MKASIVGSGAFLLCAHGCSLSTPEVEKKPQMKPSDAKKVFIKKGTCSRTFCFLLNREYGHPMDDEEKAADPLAGGILQRGHQCGMLWGASLAAGAESFRRYKSSGRATASAIIATQSMESSFTNQTKTVNCRDYTDCDFTSKWSFAKYMISGRFLACFDLAEKWAPDAIRSANKGLGQDPSESTERSVSCASEVVKQMGGGDQEAAMVAGFAGGMGLNGNGCGALSAAIWMKQLAWQRNPSGEKPDTAEMLDAFLAITGSEMLCRRISGRRFQSVREHTDYICNGGCAKVIETLACV